MPKGPRKAPDSLRDRLSRVVVERALKKGFVGGWLDTLGKFGSPPKKGEEGSVPPSTRVAAAKAGIELVTKAMGDAGASGAGEDLLNLLKDVRGKAEKLDDGSGDDNDEGEPDRPENGHRPDDTALGGEAGDMGESEGSVSGD